MPAAEVKVRRAERAEKNMRDRSARAMGRADARGRAWRRAESIARAFRTVSNVTVFPVETRDARRETRETGSTPMTRCVIGEKIHRRVVVVDRDGLTSPSRDGR